MKFSCLKLDVLVLATYFLLLVAPQAFGDTVAYNFDNLANNNPLAGQDGWVDAITGIPSAIVTNGPGIDQSQTASNAAQTTDISYQGFNKIALSNATPYASSDTNVVFMLDAYLGNSGIGFGGTNALGGLGLTTGSSFFDVGFGIHNSTGTAGGAVAFLNGFGDSLLDNTWYQIKVVLDFQPGDIRGSLSYRNLTAGESSFTADSHLQNVGLGGPAIAALYGASVNLNGAPGTAYVDNLSLGLPAASAAPLPPTAWGGLALLGFVGATAATRRYLSAS